MSGKITKQAWPPRFFSLSRYFAHWWLPGHVMKCGAPHLSHEGLVIKSFGKQRKNSRHGAVCDPHGTNIRNNGSVVDSPAWPKCTVKKHLNLPSASTTGHCTLRSPNLHKSMFHPP